MTASSGLIASNNINNFWTNPNSRGILH
jgi:hypothetical protein